MRFLVLLPFIIFSAPIYAQSSAPMLTVLQDATLYESNDGTIANGSGQQIFVGKTNQGLIRRALISFDLGSEIPASATIDSVALTLTVTRSQGNMNTITIHKVNSNWGFGASDASGQEGTGTTAMMNDATWTNTFFPNENWNTPGGDFDSEILGTAQLEGVGSYVIKGTEAFNALLSDWLNGNEENYGIILIGDESVNNNAKQLGSLESTGSGERPSLQVAFTLSSTHADIETEIPTKVILGDNYPNPFNPETIIPFSLPANGFVELSIYNMLGQKLETITSQQYAAGEHTVRFSGANLSSGIYLYQIVTPFGIESRRFTIVK